MSLASDWIVLVEDVQEQEPPRFTAEVVKQARVSPDGNMHTQLLFGNVTNSLEIPKDEALSWAQWIVATFGEPEGPPGPPVLTALVPSTATVGPGFTLTIHGSGFTPEAVVFADGAQRTTTYISSTELAAQTPTVSTPKTLIIEVSIGPTGPRSNALTFTYTAVP